MIKIAKPGQLPDVAMHSLKNVRSWDPRVPTNTIAFLMRIPTNTIHKLCSYRVSPKELLLTSAIVVCTTSASPVTSSADFAAISATSIGFAEPFSFHCE